MPLRVYLFVVFLFAEFSIIRRQKTIRAGRKMFSKNKLDLKRNMITKACV